MLAERLVRINLGRAVFIVGLLLLVVGGCRERPTTVSGTVTLDGQPLKIGPDARGTVVFSPDGGRGTVATGLLDRAGNFKLATGSSNVIAPGAYYVTVAVAQLLPSLDQEERGSQLVTPAKYALASESGLAATVSPGENHVSFDLRSDAEEGSAPSGGTTAEKVE